MFLKSLCLYNALVWKAIAVLYDRLTLYVKTSL